MSQLGRIGGQVLSDNLLRAGVDLAFETDLLYLNVTNNRIGIKDSTPSYDLDVNNNIITTILTIDNQLAIGNLRLNAPQTISTSVGGIDVYVNGNGDIFHDRLSSDNLLFDGNLISSFANSNIVFDPNGSGTVELMASSNITGNLAVSGNINTAGNLSGISSITFGDQTIDTITINTDFTQDILPGDDNTYALGADAGDSSKRHWADLHTPQWQYISNGAWPGSGLQPQTATVSSQLSLDGIVNKISAIQSNEDVFLNPNTGVTFIENTKWESNDITNLNNSPLIVSSTGIGYYTINGTNGFIMPAGTDSERRLSPEEGETRWNTDQGYVECYDGTVWVVSIGAGPTVTAADMSDLSVEYLLTLG
jgi:hypothetical protein